MHRKKIQNLQGAYKSLTTHLCIHGCDKPPKSTGGKPTNGRLKKTSRNFKAEIFNNFGEPKFVIQVLPT
jgi:hypothetical protein